MKGNFVIEALNSLDASYWEFYCAKIFGKRTVERCLYTDHDCTIRTWRGKRYLTDSVSGLDKALSS